MKVDKNMSKEVTDKTPLDIARLDCKYLKEEAE